MTEQEFIDRIISGDLNAMRHNLDLCIKQQAEEEDTDRQAIIARLERAGLLPYDGGELDREKLDALTDDEMDALALFVLARECAVTGMEGEGKRQ